MTDKKKEAGNDSKLVLIYIGRRLTSKDRLAHFWRQPGPAEKSRGYGKQIAPAVIGESWEFTLTPDESIYVNGDRKPVRLDTRADGPQRMIWAAEEAVALQADHERRVRNQLARRPGPLTQAIDTLRHAQLMLPSSDRGTFRAWVLSQLS